MDNTLKPKLSICIPVYNQSEILTACIRAALKYPGDDIEIVVQDNCSTEDLGALAASFHDPRIRYYRNDKNLGHDLNIIQSFRHARARYAFLLRTRDHIMAEAIPAILRRLEDDPNTAYLTGNAIFPDGSPRITYQTECHKKGEAAMQAHFKLYIHPSGSAYCVDMLDLDAVEGFIRKNIPNTMGFLVHVLIRMQLAQRGDFALIREPIWVYPDTRMSKDVAVNATKNRTSINTPELSHMRFVAEMRWVSGYCEDAYKMENYEWVLKRYMDVVTFGFIRINEDPLMRAHYNCEREPYSLRKERTTFYDTAQKIMAEIDYPSEADKKALVAYLDRVLWNNKYREGVRFYYFNARARIGNTVRNTRVYRLYKRIFPTPTGNGV